MQMLEAQQSADLEFQVALERGRWQSTIELIDDTE
jgi:hypothetical protein